MKFDARIALVVVALALVGFGCKESDTGSVSSDEGEESQESAWTNSYDDAVRIAREEDKLVLADFSGSDWCGWCIKLKKEVLDTKAFNTWAEERFVLLLVDFPRNKPQSDEVKKQNAALLKKYKVRGFPTILFLKPDGSVVGKTGYVRGGPDAWIKQAEQILGEQDPSS